MTAEQAPPDGAEPAGWAGPQPESRFDSELCEACGPEGAAEAEASVALSKPGFDPDGRIAALRARGAERFDPVGLRFIEALARRAAALPPEARHALDHRLADAITAYGERFERDGHEAGDVLARAIAQFPEDAELFKQQFEAGDFAALHREVAKCETRGGSGPLAGLLAHIAQHVPGGTPGVSVSGAGAGGGAPVELKSLSRFRSTWSRLSVDRQLSQAFAQAPENAGPLNPHFLVLKSLELMRDVAPGYLEQFVSYADALLWLEQADAAKPAQKSAGRSERDKKRRSGRGKDA